MDNIFIVSIYLNICLFIYFIICEKKYSIIKKIINKLKGRKIEYDEYQLDKRIKGNIFLYNYLKIKNINSNIVFMGDSILEGVHFQELIVNRNIIISNRSMGGVEL